MKQVAIKTLIKDAVITLVAFGIPFLITVVSMQDPIGMPISLFIGALPMGWRWGNKLITAVSFQGLLLKVLFSACLGFIAVPVILIGDIIKVLTAKDTPVETVE